MIPPLPRLQSEDATFNRFQDYLRQTLAQLTRNEPWKALPYATNWANFGPPNMVGGYFKDSLGIIRLRGLNRFSLGTAGGGLTICTLPGGYRPSADMMWIVPNWNGAAWAVGAVQVTSDGAVNTIIFANGGANTSGLQLDGVAFDTR